MSEPEDRDYVVWSCTVVCPPGTVLKPGMDTPPRCAVRAALHNHDIPILEIFSGWAGELTPMRRRVVDQTMERRDPSFLLHGAEQVVEEIHAVELMESFRKEFVEPTLTENSPEKIPNP
jgi:hypothetical protein